MFGVECLKHTHTNSFLACNSKTFIKCHFPLLLMDSLSYTVFLCIMRFAPELLGVFYCLLFWFVSVRLFMPEYLKMSFCVCKLKLVKTDFVLLCLCLLKLVLSLSSLNRVSHVDLHGMHYNHHSLMTGASFEDASASLTVL